METKKFLMRTLLFTALLSGATSFNNYISRGIAIPSKTAYAVTTSGKAAWAADDDSPTSFRDISSQRKLNATFVNSLVRKQNRSEYSSINVFLFMS